MGDAQAVTDRLALDQRGGYGGGDAPRGGPATIGIAHRKADTAFAAVAAVVGAFATLGPVSWTTRPSLRRSTSTDPSSSVR